MPVSYTHLDVYKRQAESIWVSTFHSSCVRILRRHIEYLGYDTGFSIYDTDDQRTLMKQVFKTLDVDTRQFQERGALAVISSAKDKLIGPEEFLLKEGDDFREKRMGEIYREYQKQLKKNNALDFDDLIGKTVELFQNNPKVLDYYQERFRYIMVDEYQDTNYAQFKLVSLLAAKYKNLCVVGDDDQSIYRDVYKRQLPGVLEVLTAEDVPNNKVGHLQQDWDVMIAVGDITRCVGDAICLVVAESRELFTDAKALVRIEYEVLAPVRSVWEAMAEDAPKLHENGNLCQHRHVTRGEDVYKRQVHGEQAGDVVVDGEQIVDGCALRVSNVHGAGL